MKCERGRADIAFVSGTENVNITKTTLCFVFFRGSAAGLQVFTCTGKGAEGSSKPLQNSTEASRAGGSPNDNQMITNDIPPDLQQTWYKIQLGGFRSNDILKLVGPATTIWQKQNWQNVTEKKIFFL